MEEVAGLPFDFPVGKLVIYYVTGRGKFCPWDCNEMQFSGKYCINSGAG